MDFLKKNKLILFIIIPVVILVLIRVFNTNHFKNDAGKLAEPSFTGSNIVTADKLLQMEGEVLLINLGEMTKRFTDQEIKTVTIQTDSILSKENLRILRNHEGPLLLCSQEDAISVRIWMLLSQMGFRELYILAEEPDPEVLKYEFRPDTTVRPEF
jgi:hypothetical protein